MLQNLLIKTKNNISERNDIQRVEKTYPYRSFTHWDIILCK